ncbi:MAG: integrase family protein [Rickettsiales bacterium]|jgi:integrase|nr:integrase family protein [Rickettsiales bacterium]
MTQQFFFYPHILDNLPLPERGFDTCRDMGDKRLMLYTTARGAKTFFVRKRVKGKDVRIVLGNYPEMSIDAAREAIVATLAAVKAPAPLHKKRVRFARAVSVFLAEKIRRVPPSKQKLARAIERFYGPLGEKYLGDIRAAELTAIHEGIAKNHGAATANRMREVVKSMFNFAIAKNWAAENPAASIATAPEHRRENKLTMTGLRKILSRSRREKDPILRAAFLMLIYGFMKKSEVFAMEWDALDLKNYFYRAHPLTDAAAVLLSNLPQVGRFVFPNGRVDKAGRHGHISDPRVSWNKMVDAAGLAGTQINDLTKLLRGQMKWSNHPETLRANMNAVLAKLA